MTGWFRGRGRGSQVRRLRRLGAAAAAGVLVVGLAAGPACAGTVRLVDSPHASGFGHTSNFGNSRYGSGDWSARWGGRSYGSDQTGGSSGSHRSAESGTATAASDPATSGESRGVVLIDTELADGSGAAGTGIVLGSNGRILTNYHVVEGSTRIRVTVATTGRTYRASLMGADQGSDVAILQLRKASGLTTADLDDDQVGIGDDVTAVGNAGGTGTLSAADGDVTALNADITTAPEGSVQAEKLTGLIETDADVVAGDSGGPLIDAEGEVIGIDTAASSGGEIDGYAIPIADAIKIADQIGAGNETAAVRIGAAAYLGVQVTEATDSETDSGDSYGDAYGNGYSDPYGSGGYSDPYGFGSGTSGNLGSSGGAGTRATAGAAVVGVEDGTPAAAAGITAGDVIVGVGSTGIDSPSALTDALAKQQPGDQVKITWVDAGGDQQTGTVTLGSSPIN